MRSDYVKLLEQRALMESQLLEARDVAIKARFIPLIAKWFAGPHAGLEGGAEYQHTPHNTFVNHELRMISPGVDRSKYQRAVPNASDVDKSWGRDTEFDGVAYYNALAEKTIDTIMAADPDRTKSFSTWMCAIFLKDQLRLEDLPRATDALELFGDLVRRKRLPAEARDINRYPDVQSVQDAIKPYKEEAVAAQNAAYEATMLAQSTVWLNTDRIIMLTPKTQKAAEWFGRDTEWCTAWGGEFGRHPKRGSLWSSYDNSPLYIVRDKTNPEGRYQFHFATGQFMDIADRRIDPAKFLALYPEVNEGFDKVLASMPEPTIGNFQIAESKTRDGGLTLTLTQVATTSKTGFAGVQAMHAAKGQRIAGDRDGSSYRLTGIQFLTSHLEADPELMGQLITILNQYRFKGDCKSSSDLGIIYDVATRRYKPALKANSVLGRGAAKWKKFNLGDDLKYVLYDGDNRVVIVDIIKLAEWDQKDSNYAARLIHSSGKHGDEIFKMLKAISNRRGLMLALDTDFFGEMTLEQGREIGKLRPDWLSAWDRYRLTGDTPATRRRMVAMIEEVTGDTTKWVGDRLVLQQWDDLSEFIEDVGTDGAKRLSEYVEGERDYTVWDPYVDDSAKEEMLESLKPDVLAQLVDYFKNNSDYADFIEEEELDFSNPVRDIIACHEYEEDSGLEQAFKNSCASAEESGALASMTEALKDAAESEANIWFLRNGKLEQKFDWNAKIVLAVTCKDICEACHSPEALSDISYSGWPQQFLENEKAGPTGDNDYSGDGDDETRNAQFADNIYNVLQ